MSKEVTCRISGAGDGVPYGERNLGYDQEKECGKEVVCTWLEKSDLRRSELPFQAVKRSKRDADEYARCNDD